jgi:hypothetical protein
VNRQSVQQYTYNHRHRLTYVVEETVDLAGGPNTRDLVTVVAEKLAPSVGLYGHVLCQLNWDSLEIDDGTKCAVYSP